MPRAILLTDIPPLCSPAKNYLVESLPLPLLSALFHSFALPFHSLPLLPLLPRLLPYVALLSHVLARAPV